MVTAIFGDNQMHSVNILIGLDYKLL